MNINESLVMITVVSLLFKVKVNIAHHSRKLPIDIERVQFKDGSF